jgi:hypothetical protein
MAEGEQPGRPAPERRKPEAQAIADHAPWKPAGYKVADAAALQALQRGDATPEQQKRALRWWVEGACATYDMSFRPGGEDGRRNTDFAEGRRFVGLQTVKLLNASIADLRHDEPQRDGHEPKD